MPCKHLSWSVLVLLALPILAISGCTYQPVTGGSGVVIAGFEPELPEVYAGEEVKFRLLIKNEGSAEAKSVYATVIGIDDAWCPYMEGKCEKSPKSESPEKLPNEEECRYWLGTGESPGTGFTLLAPNPFMGTSGSQHICTWTYKAPPIPKDFTMTYTPTARMYYSYKSYISKLITFGSSLELRNLQDKGGSLTADTKSQTSGPIVLDILTKGPIRYWQEEKQVTFPLEITISNAGSGMACAYPGRNTEGGENMMWACKIQSGEEPKNKVKIKIDFGGADSQMKLSTDCTDFQSGKTISLFQFKSNTFVCDVTAKDLPLIAPIQRIINVAAEYEYYIDKETTIKVIGRDIP